MKKGINVWTCRYCKEQNTDLENKSKDNLIVCPKCGKKNYVVF
jgi:DNA-directed RNA polymerase subunit RPC12/RpoP